MDREAKRATGKAGIARPTRPRARIREVTDTRTVEQRLADALAQKAATGEILRVMAASPTDMQPVIDAVAEQAARLCRAQFARVLLVEGDLMRPAAQFHVDGGPALPMHPVPLSRSSISGRAVLDRATVHHADILPLLDREYPEARANAAATGFRAVLTVPMIHEGSTAEGAIFVWRREPGLFPPDQVALVETFARQAAIAVGNVRLSHATKEALEQQTATAEILRVIARSPNDTRPVFDMVAQRAAILCGAEVAVVSRFDGELIELSAIDGLLPAAVEMVRTLYPMPVDAETVTARAIRSAEVVHLADVFADQSYGLKDFAIAAHYRSGLGVPILRDGRVIGSIFVGRSQPGLFTASQVALLQTFADQAVIAIENARLFTELEARNRDLGEALEQQTATNDVLRAISRSTFDLSLVLQTLVESAVRLCQADSGTITRQKDGRFYRAETYGFSREFADYVKDVPVGPERGSATGRALLEGRVVHIPDVNADPDYTFTEAQRFGEFRSIVGVPMMREGVPIGVLALTRSEVRPFNDKQIELLSSFADQAVIAIENVRLFSELEARNRDLSEALEQQTATSGILRAISRSPTDVQPVFDNIAAAALNLCGAASALVTRLDGESIVLVASANLTEEGAQAMREAFPMPIGRQATSARAIRERRMILIPDVIEDPDYKIQDLALRAAFRSTLAVPLMRDGRPVGTITVGKAEPGPFSDSQVALLETFAEQAVIAIENVRLFNELEARTGELARSVDELRALGEVGQAVSSTLDLSTVLSTIVARARALTGVEGASVYEYDEVREAFLLRSSDGLPDDLVDALHKTPMRPGEGALGRVATTRRPVEIRDVADERAYRSRVRDLLVGLGMRSMLAVPLLRENHLLGGLVINRRAPGGFDPKAVELLQTFATQSALAIQNARLYREIETKSRELETASRHKSEFLANMSHELRTPLNAIIGFSEVLAERMFGEINEKQAEYLDDIVVSGRHLLALINDILDLSKIEAGRMELDLSEFELAAVIANTLSLVRERAQRRGIALASVVDPRIGAVRADERKVKQVLLNLLSNALKFTPEGGAIDVRASLARDGVEIAVTDTGVGISPEDQATVFEEFRQVGAAAKKVEGTGLGLAISRKFVELHGGAIRVASEPGKGSTFTFTLPR